MVALPTLHFPRVTAIASAAALTVPKADCVIPISGTTTITSITAGGTGQVIILEFASAGLKVTNGSNLKLRGDYLSCAALDTLTLECDGANWVEVCRAMTPPRCTVHASGTQVVLTTTITPFLFNTEDADNAALHDTVTNNNRITFPIAGIWAIGAMVQWPSGLSAGSRYTSQLRLNGATTIAEYENSPPVAGTNLAQNPHRQNAYAATDYVELIVYQDSGGSATFAANTTILWAIWMGPA